MTTRTTRTQSAPRCARWSQDTNLAQNILAHQTAVFRITGKTSSSGPTAGTVRVVHGPDPESRERSRSDQMRSMFSVFICAFEPSPGDRVAALREAQSRRKKVRECARVCFLHAQDRNGPGTPTGSTRGLGGRRQRPAEGAWAWTERAPKSPAGVRG